MSVATCRGLQFFCGRRKTIGALRVEQIKALPMKHCMVVDDSGIVRQVARRILEQLHFEASEADGGASALEQCQKTMPDAILLDGNMPEMSGLEFLYALRRLVGGSMPVVLYCSTENDVAQITEAIEAGASEFLLKPFEKDILQAKLSEVGLA